VKPVFISVDPARDSPAKLKAYAKGILVSLSLSLKMALYVSHPD
jgi:hypothetical protein